jgi:hypothetical protein
MMGIYGFNSDFLIFECKVSKSYDSNNLTHKLNTSIGVFLDFKCLLNIPDNITAFLKIGNIFRIS